MILHAKEEEITDVLVETGYSPTEVANILKETRDVTGHYSNSEFVLEYAGWNIDGYWYILRI